jgi:hypothetical protein
MKSIADDMGHSIDMQLQYIKRWEVDLI